jgi:hypothetical protein
MVGPESVSASSWLVQAVVVGITSIAAIALGRRVLPAVVLPFLPYHSVN